MSLIKTADRHEVTIKSAQFGESQTGTPFIELPGYNDAGETISAWLYLSPAAFDRTVRVLREVFGFDNNFDTLIGQVEGKRCAFATEFETHEGKERLKVKWVNPIRTSTPIKDAGALSRFSQMAARVANEAPKAASTVTKAAPAPKAADADFPSA
jgi:hypothetical protein